MRRGDTCWILTPDLRPEIFILLTKHSSRLKPQQQLLFSKAGPHCPHPKLILENLWFSETNVKYTHSQGRGKLEIDGLSELDLPFLISYLKFVFQLNHDEDSAWECRYCLPWQSSLPHTSRRAENINKINLKIKLQSGEIPAQPPSPGIPFD